MKQAISQSSVQDNSQLTLPEKYELLKGSLRALKRVLVAFSGGVDSALLLRVAVDELGSQNVLAVTADSETYPARELEDAKRLAADMGVPHRLVSTSELAVPGYAANDRNRCYFCRHNLFEYLIPIQQQGGYDHIVYGLITDDLGDFRPGIRAAIEKGVKGPLQEAFMSKDDVRELSRMLALPTWDKPALACLSSRIAFGEVITREKLLMVDNAEEFIRGLGVTQVRVRTHGDVARIEVEPDDIALVVGQRESISRKLRELGYKYVTLDLAGYRSGSMNPGLS
ncbi:MAG TPA: ATP-dependent sacrificial sulfur transferase LarE [Spirochaetia bacterium]|nr:ATP-dependent sacrificial sulfur transferase LarE [Spirochaetia bacterium]